MKEESKIIITISPEGEVRCDSNIHDNPLIILLLMELITEMQHNEVHGDPEFSATITPIKVD